MSKKTSNLNPYELIKYFTNKWTVDKIRNMTLTEYVQVGNKPTFCHDLEKGTEKLGRIGGRPSDKFGIWRRNKSEPFKTKDLTTDGVYGWRTKYGNTAEEAFNTIKTLIIQVVEDSQNQNFSNIDGINLDRWIKWKIAFIYSNLNLFPIYNNLMLRMVAKNLRHPNYSKARYSNLHAYILSQKPEEQDFFEFYFQELDIIKQQTKRNYYILGSKYRDENGNYYSIAEKLYKKEVVATGYFWDIDFSHLYAKPYPEINKWIDKNIDSSRTNFAEAKRTLSYFLELKEGDLIAIKSKGQYGNLTIIAYAEVTAINGQVYKHDNELGHTINVSFLETALQIETKLSYGKTIHHIIPNQRKGHFEKIFGNYSSLELEDSEEELELEESRINDKSTENGYRSGSKGGPVSKAHDKLQLAFARYLDATFSEDSVRTEERFIDILRENKEEIFIYEVKPFHSPYACIRAGIGQLLDYQFKNKSSKKVYLAIVGPEVAKKRDLDFIENIQKNLMFPFEYISHSL